MRFALLAAPLLPLALALAVAGPRVEPAAAVDSWIGRDWRVSVIDDRGEWQYCRRITSHRKPQVEHDFRRRAAVAAASIFACPDVAAMPPLPEDWKYVFDQ